MKIKETQYLVFEDFQTKRKTKYVLVSNKNSEDLIGVIKWYAPWRQYCFFPASDTIWNTTCLDDVQEVISKLMQDRKTKK